MTTAPSAPKEKPQIWILSAILVGMFLILVVFLGGDMGKGAMHALLLIECTRANLYTEPDSCTTEWADSTIAAHPEIFDACARRYRMYWLVFRDEEGYESCIIDQGALDLVP